MASSNSHRTPVYFISHGGPNIMEETKHPAYGALQKIGKEITQKVKPKAVVVFSAHWRGGKDRIEVNTAEMTELIYDFYGFPDHYYEFEYPNVGSKDVAHKVMGKLSDAGIDVGPVHRGLDHGVWAPFLVAFDPKKNPLKVPLVQVSLFGNEDPVKHYKLGQALTSLRDEGILIVTSGMAVHNLRDMRFAFASPKPMPYAASFDEALKDAATASPGERERKMAELLKRPDARQAHPTFEHLLPVHVGAGAAGEDVGKQLFTLAEACFSWAQYRFGDVVAA
ncbi:aromatic ring-opening dioxygenase LigB subunit [Lineolata rhizophorae]|uniref:Aromatic ring-opening dioxygenase LigB subunit n=1 Tax=Lineolata rhizophorae TaxID=578093 RepID=A0A6A6P3C0_9PEZI|nr:aromatic ring-opening dioxygenase LigB subunit [Lineolata rhizophorae]